MTTGRNGRVSPGRKRRPQRPRPAPRPISRGAAMFRLRFGFLVIAIVLSVFGARLVQLQGLDPHAYAAMAEAEGLVDVVLPARRGTVLDRNGVALASSVDGLMVVADPELTREKAPEIAAFVAEKLGVDYFEALQRLRREDTRFQYLARRVPSTVALDVIDEAEALGFEGLSTRRDAVRDYPAHDVAANLLGYMGGEGTPLGGLELTFDEHLSGTDGSAKYEVGGGNRIPLGESTTIAPRDGEPLQLTIDRDLQWYVQRVLRQTVVDAGGESGVAVAMDSRTGELLALADYPTFDASDWQDVPEGDLGSRALSDVYEPGSVEKAFTVAALLDAGKITPTTPVTVPAKLPRSGDVINDHWEHGRERLTMTGVLAKSSNIGTVLAADRLSKTELYDYLSAFGLGRKTGIGVRGETAGLLPPSDTWSQLTQDTIAFGQGLSVNAVQMAAAVNTVANDGMRVSPSLIEGTAVTDQGRTVGTGVTTSTRVVSGTAARQTARMMEKVLDPEDGVAPLAAVDGYRVAGKTGTAERVNAETGRYDGTFTVSFAGFAPADDPRFTVYVVVQNPRNGGGGGSVAGPAFSKIMSMLLRRFAVPPTQTSAPDLPVRW